MTRITDLIAQADHIRKTLSAPDQFTRDAVSIISQLADTLENHQERFEVLVELIGGAKDSDIEDVIRHVDWLQGRKKAIEHERDVALEECKRLSKFEEHVATATRLISENSRLCYDYENLNRNFEELREELESWKDVEAARRERDKFRDELKDLRESCGMELKS